MECTHEDMENTTVESDGNWNLYTRCNVCGEIVEGY